MFELHRYIKRPLIVIDLYCGDKTIFIPEPDYIEVSKDGKIHIISGTAEYELTVEPKVAKNFEKRITEMWGYETIFLVDDRRGKV